jgi:hypothetical protein
MDSESKRLKTAESIARKGTLKSCIVSHNSPAVCISAGSFLFFELSDHHSLSIAFNRSAIAIYFYLLLPERGSTIFSWLEIE